MADTKISDLAAVTSPLGTDEFVIARSGDSKKIAAADLLATTGGMFLLHDETLSGAQATFDKTTIPGTYKHLLIVASFLPLAGNGDLHCTFNADTGSNYEWSTAVLTSGFAGINTSTSDTKLKFDTVDTVSRYLLKIDILDYADTSIHKYVIGQGSRIGSTMLPLSGRWKSNSSITQVTLSLSTGSFQSGSRCRIYGVS